MSDIEQTIADVGKAEASPERLEELKALVKQARALQIRIQNGTELLGTLSKENNKLLMDEIPDLMDTIGVPSITVEGDGNEPGFSATKKAFYSAGLGNNVDEEKREEGFNYLTSIGHGDLIKQEVSFLFPANTDQKQIHQFVKQALKLKVGTVKKKLKIPIPTTGRTVHKGTLTAWLKAQVKKGFIPKLDKIGGFIGRKVEIKALDN